MTDRVCRSPLAGKSQWWVDWQRVRGKRGSPRCVPDTGKDSPGRHIRHFFSCQSIVGKKMLNVLRSDVSMGGSYGEREFFNAEMRVRDGFDENGHGFALRGKL